MSWVNVCNVSQVKEDFPFSTTVEGKEVGIYLLEGEYYAVEDICPHAYALLSQGFIEDGKIECPLHGALFDIRTGKCEREPGERDLVQYPLRVVDNNIQITVIAQEPIIHANH